MRFREPARFYVITAYWLFALIASAASGCGASPTATSPAWSPIAAETRPVMLGTTTSTQDSGLLDVLLSEFSETAGIEVKVIAVGSGQAMKLGERGDVDLLLVHSPAAEARFMEEGYGEKRLPLMYNDFVLVGPGEDSAQVRGLKSAAEALLKIAGASAPFVSRGDQSGTHAKELSLWKETEFEPQADWYLQAGSGMSETLRIASEKGAYTLTDRATLLAQRAGLDLDIHLEGDESLLNHYSVIQVSRSKYPQGNHVGAERLLAFLMAERAREIIRNFGREKFGQPLFFLAP